MGSISTNGLHDKAMGIATGITTSALVVSEPHGPFEVKQVRLKDMRANEIVVRIKATGVCHTDVATATGHRGPRLPAILGHEGAGVVEQVGAEVKHVAVGDSVLLTFAACEACKPCMQGRPAYCIHGEALTFSGARLDGSHTASLIDGDGNEEELSSPYFGQSSFSQRAIVRGVCAVKVPSTDRLDVLCALGCGFQTGAGTVLNVLQPGIGSSLAVFGAGGVGLAAIMAAANFTPASKIIAVDIVDSRLELATRFGATHTINSKGKDIVQVLNDLTDGYGVDRAVDCTGVIPVIEAIIAATAQNGIVATVGGAPLGKSVRIEPAAWIGRGVSYIGSCQGASVPQVLMPALADFYRQGRFPIDQLITTYHYTEINQAIEDMHHGKCIKPVLLWD